MCTITLEYDSRNALARRKLSNLLSTGLFRKIVHETKKLSKEEKEEHCQLREVLLENSKRNMSYFIARHV